MKNIIYDPEELEILDYIENENPQYIPNLAQEMEQARASVQAKINKRKAINLRVLEADLEKIKTEAIKDGIPYQTLISSILHKYVNGGLAK